MFSSFDRTDKRPVLLALVVVTGVLIITQLLANSVPEDRAIKAAEDVGYSNVRVISKDTVFIQLKGCDKSDSVLFNIEGTNPTGQKRTFIVCAGWFKGATVRSI